jgi:hypothetical protein
MTCRTLALFGAVALFALAGPARASSITTYGIIVTALGNDLQVQTVDQAGAVTPIDSAPFAAGGKSSGAASDGSQSSLLITPSNNGGITVTPYSTPAASGGGSGGGGSGGKTSGVTSSSGPSPTVVTVEGNMVPTPAPDGPMPPPVTFPTAAADPVVEGAPTPVPGPSPTGDHVANSPEPASLTLLTLAGVGCLIRRRRSWTAT